MGPARIDSYPEAWRERILDWGSLAMFLLASVTFFVNGTHPVFRESPVFLMLAAGCIAGAGCASLWRSGSYRARSLLLVSVSLATQQLFLWRVGFTAAPALAGLAAIVAGGLLLGVRWAVGTWLISGLLLFGLSMLIAEGMVPSSFDPSHLDPADLAFGVRYSLSYATFAAFLAIGLIVVVDQLSRSLGDLRESEETLQGSRAQWQSIADMSADMILLLDRNHRIEFRNRAMSGFPLEGALGQPIESVLPEEIRETLSEQIDRAFEHGEIGQREHLVTDRDGHSRWLSSRVSPVMKEGVVDRVALSTTDVSDRRELEQQLHHVQKMDAVGQLAAGVAHDFNNLLTVILGTAEAMHAEMGDEHELGGDLATIRGAATRGADLTRQLLSFTRQQPTNPQTLDPNDVIRSVEPILERLSGPDVELVIRLGEGSGSAYVDRGQLEQVLTNLVVNARDAMPKGGRIAIETDDRELGEGDAASLGLAAGRYVSISVADDGQGMSKGVQERVFDPFFTTKEQGKGTGLGLATAYGIVHGAEGAIRLESRPGEGAIFDILLPLVETGAVHEARPPRAAGAVVGGETVLLVEDEDLLRELFEEALEQAGYSVLSAENGAEALDVAARNEGAIDVLVSDIRMPVMNGLELAREMSRRVPEIRIVFMTGDPAGLDLGGLDAEVLCKPFTPTQLKARLAEILK